MSHIRVLTIKHYCGYISKWSGHNEKAKGDRAEAHPGEYGSSSGSGLPFLQVHMKVVPADIRLRRARAIFAFTCRRVARIRSLGDVEDMFSVKSELVGRSENVAQVTTDEIVVRARSVAGSCPMFI